MFVQKTQITQLVSLVSLASHLSHAAQQAPNQLLLTDYKTLPTGKL